MARHCCIHPYSYCSGHQRRQGIPCLSLPFPSIVCAANKDAFEDIIRFRSDRQLNSEHCRVLRNGDWLDVTWSDVVVGDIVRLEKNETIPADVAVLSSSNEEEGLCYVETKNLDGETNLKVKRGVKSLENFRHHSDLLK